MASRWLQGAGGEGRCTVTIFKFDFETSAGNRVPLHGKRRPVCRPPLPFIV